MKYTKEQVEQRFENLPDELKEALASVETADELENIGKKHSLMLDQVSELADETGLVMLGFTKSDQFVRNVSQRLNINEAKAVDIARDVNSTILDKIRDGLRQIQEQAQSEEEIAPEAPANLPIAPTISAIEQAGGFTIENQPSSDSELYKDLNINKQAILNKIEEDHIPLVDHLLTTPISNPQKVEVKKPYTVDPYREQL